MNPELQRNLTCEMETADLLMWRKIKQLYRTYNYIFFIRIFSPYPFIVHNNFDLDRCKASNEYSMFISVGK